MTAICPRKLNNKIRKINEFLSKRLLSISSTYKATEGLAQLLAQAGYNIISDGSPGIMEAISIVKRTVVA